MHQSGIVLEWCGPMVVVRYDTTPPRDPRADCRNRIWLEDDVSSDLWYAFDEDIAEEVCEAIMRAAKAIRAAQPFEGSLEYRKEKG